MTAPQKVVAPGPGQPEISLLTDVLDHAVWSSLAGPHAHLAEGSPAAWRYPPDVAPFAALPPMPDAGAWAALAGLAGPDGVVTLAMDAATFDQRPASWAVEFRIDGVQMIATDALSSAPDTEAVLLGADDAEEMLDLVERTKPGPFRPRTYRLGRYLGLRRDGALVAMAGERLHPPGFTEISAVCTDPQFRGQGLAARLVGAVADGIRARRETPFLHTAGNNTNAIRLYESLGFILRRRVVFVALRPPVASE